MEGTGGPSGHLDDGDGPCRGRMPVGHKAGKPDRTGPAVGTPAVLDPDPNARCGEVVGGSG